MPCYIGRSRPGLSQDLLRDWVQMSKLRWCFVFASPDKGQTQTVPERILMSSPEKVSDGPKSLAPPLLGWVGAEFL